jgi:hypothetical protein
MGDDGSLAPEAPASASSTRSARTRKILRWIALSAAVIGLGALVVQQLFLVGDFRVDDAYISFSFAKNLAAGEGLVYSHGLRVEGYSNFLWVLVVSLGFLVAPSADPYITARLFGFAFLGLGVFATYRLTRLRAPTWAAFGAVGLLLVSSDVFRATLSGLETVPFMSALAFGWYAYLKEPPEARRWSLCAFLPVALMRIDGFGPMGFVIAFELASSIVERRFRLKTFARWLAVPVLVWGAYFLARWAYYGLPLPTTYYAKSMVNANEPLRGWNQLWAFVHDYGVWALAPFMILAIARGPRRPALALAGAVLAQVFYAASVGGDWMPFQRFFLPIFPLCAVLTAWGVARVWDERWCPAWVRAAGTLVAAAAVGYAGVCMNMGSIETPEERYKLREARHVTRHTHENLLSVMDLARYVVREPGDKFVTDFAGVFAVYTEATVIDMWGLCNADIALNGGLNGINPIYGKECAACYARIQPDYFHTGVPMVRRADKFSSVGQMLGSIFQGRAIDRVIGLRENFAAGRVVEEATGRVFWFLERRRAERPLVERRPAPGIRVDYPFEPG